MDVVVVPSAPALLPGYAGLEDPVPEVRAAARAAVGWLVGRHPARLGLVSAPARADNVARGVSEPVGSRVAGHLLGEAGFAGEVVPARDGAAGVLVVANGSACRSEKAPGHLDERSFGFDDAVEGALRAADPGALQSLDETLGREVWCDDVAAWRALGRLAAEVAAEGPSPTRAELQWSGDPYGVQYWVARWSA
jgi:hypothetical protein